MTVKLKMFTTGKIFVETSVPELETRNVGKKFGKNLGVSKIWVYNETCFFYIYPCDCNVSWVYRHKD